MKKAFTLLELIFIVLLMGIVAGMTIPKTTSTSLDEAGVALLEYIRYTQHLAMINDKFDSNDENWYMKRWQLIFGKSLNSSKPDTHGKWAYTIFSDNTSSAHHSNPNLTELARDPSDFNKYLSGGYSGILSSDDRRANKKMNLGMSYGVTDIYMSQGCSHANVRISFDVFGRPIQKPLHSYTMPYKSRGLIRTTCKITITNGVRDLVIAIEPETGYAHIL